MTTILFHFAKCYCIRKDECIRAVALLSIRAYNCKRNSNLPAEPTHGMPPQLYYYRHEIYIWLSAQVTKYEREQSHVDSYMRTYSIARRIRARRVDLYFFAHMCTSFPVIVSGSNKTADATCPRRKTGQTNFVPSHDTPPSTPRRRKNDI